MTSLDEGTVSWDLALVPQAEGEVLPASTPRPQATQNKELGDK